MGARVLSAAALFVASVAFSQTDPHAGHDVAPSATPVTAAVAPEARDPSLPPSDQTAKAQLDSSPRHGEFVDVKFPSGAPVKTWIVYPERRDKAGVVIVIHEIFGLSDWIRGVADQLAREGFIAVAPDLISGHGPGGGGTDSVGSRDEVVQLIRSVGPEEVTARLNAVRDWAVNLPAANGRSATVGFCWGGGQSFAYAAVQPKLDAAVVYYGTPPDAAALARVQAPVLGLYGGDDARIGATIPGTEAEMKRLGKKYEPHVYEGAGHGFLRAQGDRNGANRKATREAWPRTIALLKERLR